MSIPYGILINTNLVKAADEPKSWADVADPKWKGKILADDTRAAGGGYLWYFVTYGALGEEFHHKVAANGPIFTRDQRESQRRIARGEFALYLPLTLPDSLALKGLPVKAIMPDRRRALRALRQHRSQERAASQRGKALSRFSANARCAT